MRVVAWDDGRVSTRDAVEAARPLTGQRLRDGYAEAVSAVTFGLVTVRANSVVAGPLALLRFGKPKVGRNSVDWPIEGGLLAGRPGGSLRVQASGGTIEATVTGYAPSLPRPIYDLTQLQVHQLFTRLYLLRLRGPEPGPGVRPTGRDRFRAASVDVAFVLTMARLTGRRRIGSTLVIAAAYHVACWSTFGRTLGGLVMRQRVVAVDGTRLSATQAFFRFLLIPASWASQRPLHDELASSEVITG